MRKTSKPAAARPSTRFAANRLSLSPLNENYSHNCSRKQAFWRGSAHWHFAVGKVVSDARD